MGVKDTDSTKTTEPDCAIIEVEDEGKWRTRECNSRKDSRGRMLGVMCQRLPNVTEDGNMRVMMGKSACDDAVKDIEKDLNYLKRDTECQTDANNDDKIVTLKEGTETA